MLTAPFVSLVLALASIVSGVQAYDIEPRNGGDAVYEELLSRSPQVGGRVIGRVAQAGRNAAFRAPARAAPRVRPATPPAGGSSSTTKAAKAGGFGFLGAKLAGGGTVGLGSLIAQNVDSKFERRDLEARNGAKQFGRLGVSTLRNAARPAARTATRPIVPPRAAPAPKFAKTKMAGAFTATALTAGGGEYYGGKVMGNAIDRLEQADGKKRDLDEELVSRSPQVGAALGRVAGPALRAGRSGAARNVKNFAHRPPPSPSKSSATRKAGTAAFIGGAAASGGFLEGMVQNITPETQEKLRQNPKDTISKMLPANTFGGRKREYVEDLVTRGGSSLEPVERLMARAVVDMLLYDM